ncbi:type ISP restriction/modification enzyme [Candidatus Phytoplasma meliae]|uniref:DEAD/DEAH box helicase family protein n=1 Tax=Candidatus Phytoplasma meliae TaxID=1848402 RepID=A0ABS5CY40_9MOLU|nr:type ISP restriction/modification enzyme [Candidatus Phytoplasma meliae]MBP5835889.1 DEAD/DEAH box helicase family protein [Candidatus Phytoplasma meliae]
MGEKKVLQWLHTHPQFKLFDSFEPTKTNTEGIDFIGFIGDEKIAAIQVKNYASIITGKDIFNFVAVFKKENEYQKGIFVNVGEGKLTHKAANTLRENNIDIIYDILVDDSEKDTRQKPNLKSLNYQLYDHQKEAVEKAKSHYQKNDKGILEMACGTGKTFVSKKIMESLLPEGGLVFYFVPWLSLLEQSMYYFNDDRILTIPVCSTQEEIIKKDREMDLVESSIIDLSMLLSVKNLNTYRNRYKYIMIFCTYQSRDKLIEQQRLNLLPKADFMICDEAHHTVCKSGEQEEDCNLHEDLKAAKKLFMTATVKVYRRVKSSKDDLALFDMNNEKVYGTIFYSLDLGTAIEKDILCDYDVLVARFDKDAANKIYEQLDDETKQQSNLLNKNFSSQENKFIKKIESDQILEQDKQKFQYELEKFRKQKLLSNIAQVVAVYKAMEKSFHKNYDSTTNSVSGIAFVNSSMKQRSRKAKNFAQNIFKILNEERQKTHSFNLATDYIEGTMSPLQRQEKLDKLVNQTPFLLWNCRCLTEGIDVPQCDTIVFFDHKQSYIEIIQAIGRALRKDPHNPSKKATIILPFNIEESLNKGISLDNKEFFKLFASILAIDSRNKNLKTKEKRVKDATGRSDLGTEENNKNSKDYTKEIDFCNKYVNLELKKMSRVSWKNVVFEIKKTLDDIQKIVANKSSNLALKKITKTFGTILKIHESAVDELQAGEILAQYILFYPILKKIYNTKEDLVFKSDLDQDITALNIDAEIKSIADKTINFFLQTLGFQYQKLDDKEHIFNQIYNDVLKETNPTLTKEKGMYYTPEWIVKVLWDLLIHLGKLDFRNQKHHILDPAAGTAPFVAHFLRHHVFSQDRIDKYYDDLLHIQEINFTSYMIGLFKVAIAANKDYFLKNAHWGDSLKPPAENDHIISKQGNLERNKIKICITNPPWRGGQKKDTGRKQELYLPKDSDAQEKGKYWVDERIKETFVKNTSSQNPRSLYDMYCRFLRWSLDKIHKGWIAMVLPNSFLTTTVEGLRISLTQECQKIYIVDLKGKAGMEADPTQEGENVFKTETQEANTRGCCLLLCYLDKDASVKNDTFYVSVPPESVENKKHFIETHYKEKDFFQKIMLNKEGHWFFKSEKLPKGWQPLTKKEHKQDLQPQQFYFTTRNDGIVSGCDEFVYYRDYDQLKERMISFIQYYNECRFSQETPEKPLIMKWHDNLRKKCLQNKEIIFDENKIIKAYRRPFDKQYLYFDSLIIDEIHNQDKYYSHPNLSLCVSDKKPTFDCLIVDCVPHASMLSHIKCYPLSEFIPRPPYQPKEWMAILYALFHHKGYKQSASNFLKHNLPTIPPLTKEQQEQLLPIGKKLMELHLNYEIVEPTTIYHNSQDVEHPENYIKYHSKMPYVPKVALEYCLQGKPMLYKLRDSEIFGKLTTVALETALLLQQLNKIELDLE